MTTNAAQLTPDEFAEERDRIRDINALGKSTGFPQLAELLAFETDLSLSQAEKAFAVASQDRARRRGAAS